MPSETNYRKQHTTRLNNIVAIEVSGEFLDLNESALRIEKTNPFFSPSVYQGDYSFPFILPNTDKNVKIFGFANIIDSSLKKIELKGNLYVYGVPYLSVKILVTKANRKNITVVLTAGIKTLLNADVKLNELFKDVKLFLGNASDSVKDTTTLISKEEDWKVYGFTFVPFYAPNFYNSKNPSFCGVINRMNSTNGDILFNNLANPNKYTQVPWFFLHWVLNELFKKEGLTPKGSFWNHPEYQKLLITNYYAIEGRAGNDNTRAMSKGVQVLNTHGQKPEFDPYINGSYDGPQAYDVNIDEYTITTAGDYTFNIDINGRLLSTASIRPPVPGGGYFRLIYDGLEVAKTPWLNTDWAVNKSWILTYSFTAAPTDIGKTLYVEYDRTNVNQGQTYFEMSAEAYFDVRLYNPEAYPETYVYAKNHLPNDWTMAQLLNEVKKLGVNIEINNQLAEIQLDLISDKLKETPVPDLTGRAEKDYENDLESYGRGYQIDYEFSDEEKAIKEIDSNKFIGEFFESAFLPTPSKEGDLAILTLTNEVLEVQPSGSSFIWAVIGHNYQSKLYGSGKEKLAIKLKPSFMCIQNNEGGTSLQNTALMPYFNGIGSSSLYGLGINSFTPTILFLRGQNRTETMTSPRGGNYILASSQRYGINHDVVGDISLRLDESNGAIIQNCDTIYKAITNGEVVEKNLYFTAIDFLNLRSFSKWIVENNLYLTKSLSIFINNRSAKVKAYLLKL
jgi:hypothetical protein